MEPLPSLEVTPVSEQAYQVLRRRILSKELAPGQRLDIDEICKQLAVSRTPVNEALRRLEVEGLVQIVPRSRTIVSDPRPMDILESFELRRLLEVHAAGLAVGRATPEQVQHLRSLVARLGELSAQPDRAATYPQYLATDQELHRCIVALAGSRRLSVVHERENLHAQMARVRYRSFERELSQAQAEHEQILDAFAARDVEATRQLLDRHLERAKRSILADMGVDYDRLVTGGEPGCDRSAD